MVYQLTNEQIKFIEWLIEIDASIPWKTQRTTAQFLRTILKQGRYSDRTDKKKLNNFRDKYKEQYRLK